MADESEPEFSSSSSDDDVDDLEDEDITYTSEEEDAGDDNEESLHQQVQITDLHSYQHEQHEQQQTLENRWQQLPQILSCCSERIR